MIKYLPAVGLIALSCCLPAVAVDPAANAVIVEIDGAKLTLGDLEIKNPAVMFQARNSFYEAQKKAVEDFVGDYLLERQAAKEHVTVAELLEKHVNSAAGKDPSDESLRVYYEGIDTNEPFEAVRGRIVDAIRQRRITRAKTAYMQSLREQASVAIRMTPPRAQISLKNTPIRGGADAPVILVEYADYECPYCQQIQPVIDKLAKDYAGKLSVAFKDMPLPMHANAQKASEASHCAGAQGKYWEYHDVLFTGKYEISKLKDNARTLKLDAEAFDRCLDNGEQADRIKTQFTEAATGLGLTGTPGFFINGRFLSGAVSYDILRQVVEEELHSVPAVVKQRAAAPANQ
jgi:protein-disulfide isomerase